MRAPCLDCTTIHDRATLTRGRCPACHAQRYGGMSHAAAHTQARRLLEATLPTPCGRCGNEVASADQWDADLRPWGWEVAHAACNRSAGALGIA